MKVFEIEVKQWPRGEWGHGSPWQSEVYHIKAQTATQALKRAMRLARANGFMKTYPLDATSIQEIVPSIDG